MIIFGESSVAKFSPKPFDFAKNSEREDFANSRDLQNLSGGVVIINKTGSGPEHIDLIVIEPKTLRARGGLLGDKKS